MNTVKHYWGVYTKFISTSSAVNMSFRTSLLLLILMDVFFFLSTLASVEFIFDHIQNLGPWDKGQLMFFISFMLAIDNLHMMLISESFWVLSFDIRTGQLDYTLLKPVHSIFASFFRWFRPSSLITLPLPWGFVIFFGMQLELTPLSWIAIPLLAILGLAVLVSIEFIISAAMFWITEGVGINFLRMQLQQLARWPNFIYGSVSRKVLTIFIPILLVGSGPVHFIFDHSLWEIILQMIGAIIVLWFILLKVWNKGLRRYDSASS